jgi:hypothetical protein
LFCIFLLFLQVTGAEQCLFKPFHDITNMVSYILQPLRFYQRVIVLCE